MNDMQIDHFGALMKNAGKPLNPLNEDAQSYHQRTDRISFLSRRSIFNHPRVHDQYLPIHEGVPKDQDFEMTDPVAETSKKPINAEDLDLKADDLSDSKEDATEVKIFAPTIIQKDGQLLDT